MNEMMKIDNIVNTNDPVDVTNRDELNIYLTYADLLLKHSRNQEIGLPEGRLISPDEDYYDYHFDIGLDTYKKLKSIRTDYKFEYEKKEYECSIIDLEKDHVRISLPNFPLKVSTIQQGVIVVNMRFIIERQKKALETLTLPKFENMRKTIFGDVNISGGRFTDCDFESLSPNEKQKIAIQHAVGVRDVYLIWGPPGTGKTTVVPDIVRNYITVQKGKGNLKPRVLVCSYTNAAVDNITKKLFPDFKSMIVRLGKSTTLTGIYKNLCLDERVKGAGRKLDEQLTKKIDGFNGDKKILKNEEETYVNQLDVVDTERKLRGKKKDELEKEIITLENQKHQRTHQIIVDYLKKKRKEIENRIIQNSKKLEELSRYESLLLNQINKTKSEISEIERDITDYIDTISAIEKEIQDKLSLIKIVGVYLGASKKNMISSLFTKNRFKWHDPLYNRYGQEIEKLKINEMDFRGLESLSAELIIEKDNIQKRITETKNKLKEAKEGKGKETVELEGMGLEQVSMKKEILELTTELKKDNKKFESVDKQINSKRIQLTDDELQQINLKSDKKLLDINNDLDEQNRLLNDQSEELDDLESKQKSLSDKIKSINKKVKGITEQYRRLKSEIEEKKSMIGAQILQGCTVIATTNMMAGHKALQDISFDLVIMDEAGAIDLLGAVIPLLKTSKVIFLGDPNQLPPVIVKNSKEIENFLYKHPDLEKSIFERFYEQCSGKDNDDKVVMLRKQYRMRKEISDFVSTTFYGNKLEYGKSGREYILIEHDDQLLDSRHPMLCLLRFFYTGYEDNNSGSGYCIRELMLIKNIIENFRKVYGEGIVDKIAVITPFRAQVSWIKEEIPDVECGTVHTFQGQEKDIIIYSTVRYHLNSDGTFGKLFDPENSRRLLNVAVSRAREKFIIIGWWELFNGVEVYKQLYSYIEEHGGLIKRKLRGYDEQNTCKSCGKNIEDRYEYCYVCRTIEQERTFLEDRPRTVKAMDGDLLRSNPEVRIDDWFYNKGIEHIVEKEVPIQDRLMYYDWFLPKKDRFIRDIYVEYWGVENKDYEKVREIKEKLYRKHKLTLLSIEVEDMNALDEILDRKLKKYRVSRKDD